MPWLAPLEHDLTECGEVEARVAGRGRQDRQRERANRWGHHPDELGRADAVRERLVDCGTPPARQTTRVTLRCCVYRSVPEEGSTFAYPLTSPTRARRTGREKVRVRVRPRPSPRMRQAVEGSPSIKWVAL